MTGALLQAPWLASIARLFDRAGAPLYLVGGAVRNPLMDLPISDIDVCGPALPREVCALCEDSPVRAVIRAEQFGTVELHVTDETGADQMAEYTAFRQDSYTSGHRPAQVRFTKDLSVDALRRDFSVNALYQRVHEDGLEPVIDPTGGLEALRRGLLHTVTEDPDLVLQNDGLRILRAVRFAAELALTPTPALVDSLHRYAPLVRDVAMERLRDEWRKILLADTRYPSLARSQPATEGGLLLLDEIGLFGFLADGLPLDEKAAQALQRLPLGLSARLALLLRAFSPERGEAAARAMRFSAAEAQDVSRYLRALSGTENVLAAAQWGEDALQTAATIRRALGQEDGDLQALLCTLQGKPQSLRQLAVRGSDLRPLITRTGLSPSCTGQVLNTLWKAVLEGRCPNEREALICLAENDILTKWA